MDPVRVRFAPSPTGRLHLGGGRTALYNYLLAAQTGGQFILRIEDTDRKRYVEGAEQEIYDSLRWLGLEWDEGPDKGGLYGPYRQSERKAIYLDYARKLVDLGHAYYCFCTPERLESVRREQQANKQSTRYDGACRHIGPEDALRRVESGERHVIRFRSPDEGQTTVTDLLRGNITVENETIDDFILIKSDGFALYHLAAAVDDHLMKITHVLRGAEWLPTFPLHGLIHRAFGWQEPVWVHLSVFLKPSGSGKLSKRDAAELIKDGHSIFLKDFHTLGYLPEAVTNWIALMGWSYDDHTEIFSMKDLVEKFSLIKLNPSPAAINFSKLDHFNGVHIRQLPQDDLVSRIGPFLTRAGYNPDIQTLEKVAPLIRERMVTLDDSVDMAGFFFQDAVTLEPSDLIGKDLDASQTAVIVKQVHELLQQTDDFSADGLEQLLREFVDQSAYNNKQVFGILRVAITGQRVSPPLFETMEIVGKDKALVRLLHAIALLEKIN